MADSPRGRLDLGATLAEAVRRMPDMWRGAGGALALAAGLMLLNVLVPIPSWADIPGGLLAVGAVTMAFGAITRIGVAESLEGARVLGLGRAGVQWRWTETRLVGAVLLLTLFLTIILSLLALVALALFGGAGLDAEAVNAGNWADVGPTWKLALLAGVALVVIGTPWLLAVRLSLFAQATVGRGQMISLTATALTNGAILPLAGGLVVCGLPMVILIGLVVTGFAPNAVAGVAAIVIVMGLQAPLTSGFLGAAYRRLETHSSLGAWQ